MAAEEGGRSASSIIATRLASSGELRGEVGEGGDGS